MSFTGLVHAGGKGQWTEKEKKKKEGEKKVQESPTKAGNVCKDQHRKEAKKSQGY